MDTDGQWGQKGFQKQLSAPLQRFFQSHPISAHQGQNVSVLQVGSERWKPPVTVFSSAGGNVSRNNSLGPGKNISMVEKKSSQQLCKNSSAGAYVNSRNKELTANGVNSSILNSGNRELSPVRWCDRKVDGVYLGRSGWVHVQQRSLDDNKRTLYCDNSFYTLPCRKHFSETGSCFGEERECNRSLDLPLSSKKLTPRESYQRPSKFVQQFESISPPSVTPIISPPPAFKDDGLHVDFPRQSVIKPLYPEELFQAGRKGSCCPPKEKQNILQPLACGLSTGSSVSALKQEHLPYQTFQVKSVDDDFSNKMWHHRHNTVGFHSLNTDVTVQDCDSFSKNFENPEGKINSDEYDKDVDINSVKLTDPHGYFLGLLNSSKEELRQRNALKAFRQRNYQRNGRRTSNAHRTRSSSSDSSSSSSNQNLEKTASSRRANSKEKQTFEFENSTGRNSKQFHVKRSRSLQLSEKRSPSESIPINSSGKSWDSMPPEYSMFQVANPSTDTEVQFPQHLRHILVTVNGDSIPVCNSGSQSLKSLNKITTSEEEQKKLIMEAEKEARIISDFLSGTKSREAARNLLMHRYYNRHKDVGSIELSENSPPKDEYEVHFLESRRRENFWKNKPNSPEVLVLRQPPTTVYPKPFKPFFRASNSSGRTGSLLSLPNLPDKRKKDGVETKGSGGSYSSSLENCNKGRPSKNKSENIDRFLSQTYQNSTGEEPYLRCFEEKRKSTLDKDTEALQTILKNAPHILTGKNVKEIGRDLVRSSSLSTSSSSSSSSSPSPPPEVFQDVGARIVKKIDNTDACLNGKTKTHSAFRFDCSPGSDGFIATALEQRSFSLPRSFLSGSYRLNYSDERDLFWWKHQDEETLEESTSELPLNSQHSRTVPTTSYASFLCPTGKAHCVHMLANCLKENHKYSDTLANVVFPQPTRDLRYGKCSESLSQLQFTGGSINSPLGESPFTNSQRIVQTFSQGKADNSDVNSTEGSTFSMCGSSQQLSDNSSESVFQKFKKNFPLKYLKTKGNSKDSGESNHRNIGHESVENSCEEISAAISLLSGLQAHENDDKVSEKALRIGKEQNGWKKVFKNDKYDSHDSGIQIGIRGNVDSSESQDTDLQEDIDSPLLVRKNWIRGTSNFCRRESENFDKALTDRLKADIQCQNKMRRFNYGNGVRRTNSDTGSRKLDFKNTGRGLLLASYPSPKKYQNTKTLRGLPGPDSTRICINLVVASNDIRYMHVVGPYKPDQENKLNPGLSFFMDNSKANLQFCNLSKKSGFAGAKLKRSQSQPQNLNELAPRLKSCALSEDEKDRRERNSEDECLSDSESSVASLHERKKSFDTESRDEAAVLAEAVWDHVAIESFELPFKAGDVIEVLDTQNWDWWWGATAENRGYFPSAFVRLRVNQEDTVEDCLAAMASGKYSSNRLRRGKSVSLLSNDQVRTSVVRELLNTEQDFVKILRDIKEGYLEQCKQRPDMFTSAQITAIFSNLEDVLLFQEKFLKDLETSVDKKFPYKSCIGHVFLTHGAGFRMYSEYCNSHPMAIATLQDLYQRNGYCEFFETCRLKRSLIEIPLDGYLLTPVQRICKYPLQLAELLKYTKPEHPDFKEVEEALETMRGVATLINERKRKMESLEKLAAWQQRVEGWEGEDLIEISSRLIYQGDVVRITSGVWTSNITLFLFDHQIVYCKKDLLKRNVYIYKGRIFLDASVVVDVPDGKNQQLGVTVKYGLKICSSVEDKWLLFCCRTSEDKAKWLDALAEEKRLVSEDKQVDLDLPPAAKRLAKMAARTKKCPPCKPNGKNKCLSYHEEMPFRNCRPSASKTKSSRRVGTWFTLGGVIRNSKTSLRQRTSLHRIT